MISKSNNKRFNPFSLDAINFLLADRCGVLGPFLDVFLVTQRHWNGRRRLNKSNVPDGKAQTLFIALSLVASLTYGADPQPYAVDLAKTGNAALDQTLTDSSSLISLRENAPVGPFALVARAQGDLERFTAALNSQGFYKAKIEMRIAGHPLDDPELVDLLTRAPPEPPVAVGISFEIGPLFHLRKIEIRGEVSDQIRDQLALAPGAPALAAAVLAGRERLLGALRDEGHALAKVEEPNALLVPEADALDIAYPVDAGPRVDLGPIRVDGLKDVNESYVRHHLLIADGDPFKPEAIEAARQDLTKTGVFSSVRITAAEAVDGQGRLPIRIDVAERPLHAVSVGADFSTDLGGSFSTTWQHRNLFGNAEQLNLSGAVTQIGGNSTTGIGYTGSVGFVRPDFYQHDQSLQVTLAALKQSLDAYDQKAIRFDVSLQRKFHDHWITSLGLAGEESEITQQQVSHQYTLLSLPMAVKYDTSNNLLDPTQGIRATLSLTPMQPLGGGRTQPFSLIQVSGSTYFDLAKPGRSVLALRGVVGNSMGANQFDLPPDKRLYAGGSATVRGYQYQSIGPQFSDNKPQGGTALATGTVEFRQRVLENYGVVTFADIGQVNAEGNPFSGQWRLGAGIGLRYYTAFGPLRLDVALPVNKQPGSNTFEVYLGLGQAF
ncbi:translocation and assembly module TamA [Gammaproteobacteria bacterium]